MLAETPVGDEFDTELHDWVLMSWRGPAGVWPVICGRVRNDRKGPFRDDRLIHTSVVLSPPAEIASGRIIPTLNTRYLPMGAKH